MRVVLTQGAKASRNSGLRVTRYELRPPAPLRNFSLAVHKLTGTGPVRTMGSVGDNEVETLRIGLS